MSNETKMSSTKVAPALIKAATVATTNNGFPFADRSEAPVYVDACDVAFVGKLTCWGSRTPTLMIKTARGLMYFVRASDQLRDGARWLRDICKRTPASHPTRSEGWRYTWISVP